ncbi:MAG: transporter substrate-binding domain-containing protein [Acidimicrobiia bacterium]
MNKKLSLISVFAVLAMVLAACGDGTGTDGTTGTTADAGGLPDLGGETVTIAVENAYLPFNYVNLQTKEAGGWDYDAWAEICRLLNCEPEFVETAWDGMIVAVSEGQYDAAADGITINDERAEVVDFSDGYVSVEQRLLVRADEDRFTEAEEFAADETLLMGSQSGTTNFQTAVDQIFDGDANPPRLLAFETFSIAVQALLNGEVDAVLMDETAGQGYVGVNADSLKVVGESLSSDQLGFIFPPGSDLVDSVNAALDEMRSSGFLDELADRYFSDQFAITYDDICQGAYAEEGDEC